MWGKFPENGCPSFNSAWPANPGTPRRAGQGDAPPTPRLRPRPQFPPGLMEPMSALPECCGRRWSAYSHQCSAAQTKAIVFINLITEGSSLRCASCVPSLRFQGCVFVPQGRACKALSWAREEKDGDASQGEVRFERGGKKAKPRKGLKASGETKSLSFPPRVPALWAGGQVTNETRGRGFLGAPLGAVGTRQGPVNLGRGGPRAAVGWKVCPPSPPAAEFPDLQAP